MALMGFRSLAKALGLAISLASWPADASGRLPVPPSSQMFASHRACVSEIERQYADDQRRIAEKTVEADGSSRETSLETSGIERTGTNDVRYQATIWYHHGRVRTDLGKIETSHSFETRLQECKGAMLHMSGETGYTLSTFEPWKKSAP
ncbi:MULTISPECIES: hypothetical protein [unclassified Methylosinus]|uniref:hypothetical protein n=1 Tax=unclassified Methylosinus TaxID=2624500 RepID=UPI0012F704C1|nr:MULTISPECIES: hypothetical protein [unclassified Methylosinus]